MASAKEYAAIAQLVGKYLLPIGLAHDGEAEDDIGVQGRQGLVIGFIEALSDWYQADNPRFSRELFAQAVTDHAEENLNDFAAWCERNGGIEYLNHLIQERLEETDFPDLSPDKEI